MSWIDKLYETYENCQEYVGKDREDMLLPIAHTTNNAQIQVTLNQDAEIVMAEKVPKENAVTIIPCTEDSASRGVGIFPHALFDKLIYIAGDYADSISEKGRPYHEAYETLLDRWCASEDCHRRFKLLHGISEELSHQDLVRFGCLVERRGYRPICQNWRCWRRRFRALLCQPVGVQENPRCGKIQVWQSYIRFYEGQQENRRSAM
ncbi:MAG: type I-C CRISPR-associated protein Cas8c/Csd1 [Bianqueaceae bacterium]